MTRSGGGMVAGEIPARVTDPMKHRRPNPKRSKDGNCLVCSKPIKLPASFLGGREHYESEPFCSRVCAEQYFGVTHTSQAGKA